MESSTSNLSGKAKVVKSRARKDAANKKRPRRMVHIHGGRSESEIVWGQRWFRSGVDHATGGHESELHFGNESPPVGSPSSDTPSACPSQDASRAPSRSPSGYAASIQTSAPRPFDATLPTSPTSFTSRQNPGSHLSALSPSADTPAWLLAGYADNPSVSYEIFSPPFAQADQMQPNSSADSFIPTAQAEEPVLCDYTYTTMPYATYNQQALASPISAPSPASSDGWTLSPARHPSEVEPAVAGYGLVHEPPSNLSSALFSPEVSHNMPTHAGRPRTTYPSFHASVMPSNSQGVSQTRQRTQPRTPASGLPAYHLAPHQSRNMSRVSDNYHSSSPLSPARNVAHPSSNYAFSSPSNDGEAFLFPDYSGYPSIHSNSMTYAPSSQQYPFLEYGNRFDTSYGA